MQQQAGEWPMLRRTALIATALLSTVALPTRANATVFDINIFANVTGTDSRANCGPGQNYPFCPMEVTPYEASISRYLGPLDLVEGDNPFTYGGFFSSGLITGTINNESGLLTGRNLTYAYAACSGPCPGDHILATTSTFLATGGVPEARTWIMLLVGIGAIGWSLRNRRNALSETAV